MPTSSDSVEPDWPALSYPPMPLAAGDCSSTNDPPRTNRMAVAAMVLGILGWWFLAVILGYIARDQIRNRGEVGDGMAIAGIVLGWAVMGLIGLLLLGLVFGLDFGDPGPTPLPRP